MDNIFAQLRRTREATKASSHTGPVISHDSCETGNVEQQQRSQHTDNAQQAAETIILIDSDGQEDDDDDGNDAVVVVNQENETNSSSTATTAATPTCSGSPGEYVITDANGGTTIKTVLPRVFDGPVPPLQQLLEEHREPDDQLPPLDQQRDSHKAGELSNPVPGTFSNLTKAPTHEKVKEWQRCLLLALPNTAIVKEHIFDANNRFLYTLQHRVARKQAGGPLRGSGSGGRHFRARKYTAHHIRGLYESDRRRFEEANPGERIFFSASHTCHRGFDTPVSFFDAMTKKVVQLACINPAHHVWESTHANSNRIGCAGFLFGCQHVPPCLRPAKDSGNHFTLRTFGFEP